MKNPSLIKLKMLVIGSILTLNGILAQQNSADTLELWTTYLRKKSQPIKLTPGTDDDDLKGLKKVLSNKRIVLLGEFNHGSKEINLLKNRLIAYLVQALGYKVLLLESGVAEVNTLNHQRQEMSKENMIFRLTGPWQSKEFVDLMGFVQAQEELILGGFDPQKSGGSFVPFFKGKFEKIDPQLVELLSQTELKNQNFTREIQRTELTPTHFATRDSIIQDYQQILTSLNIKRMNEKQLGSDLKVTQKALENRIAYLHYFTNYKKQLRQRWAARDSMMAANIIWYATELYPQEKIIISAHNYHISKFNEKELVMGELLKAQFPEELYTIGFFGGQGTFANNSRKPENLSPGLEHKDIKTLIASLKSEAAFFDFPHKNSKNTTWLEEQLLVNDTFIDLDNHNKMHLGKCFDGLFLIKNITPAVY